MKNENYEPYPSYIGNVHPDCNFYHGRIPYMKGVHLHQVSRANRGRPELDDGTGHTYKHAPDITWYNGRFYIQYLTNPEDEHGGAGVSVLASSKDGKKWGDFQISFPEYWIPACEVTDYKGNHHVFDGRKPAFMHQRMSFYQASNNVLLVLGFYGWAPELWMTNWDNYGIGRVVRRLMPDGTLGPIWFIRVNWQGGWKKENLLYPEYTESEDQEFLEACRELLKNPLFIQQWAEENGDKDPQIRVKHPENGTYQAFCWYHREEKEVVGLWKHSFVSCSHDNGETWEEPRKSNSLVMSGQKIWGCRTDDGRYALIYDPTLETQHRFPMCIVTSEDGLVFDRMLLVHGEVPPLRYKGFCKDLGPQYMRGICEGMQRPDGNVYLTYSVGKEDIWFASLPVPVEAEEEEEIQIGSFTEKTLESWNLYQPVWSRIEACDGWLRIENREPYDYARAVRLIPRSKQVRVRAVVSVEQLEQGMVQLELSSLLHQTAVRLIFRPDGILNQRTVCELGLGRWEKGKELELVICADCETFSYTVSINGVMAADSFGRALQFRFMEAVNSIDYISLRTGAPRYLANLEENPDNKPEEPLAGCEEPAEPVCFAVKTVEVTKIQV